MNRSSFLLKNWSELLLLDLDLRVWVSADGIRWCNIVLAFSCRCWILLLMYYPGILFGWGAFNACVCFFLFLFSILSLFLLWSWSLVHVALLYPRCFVMVECFVKDGIWYLFRYWWILSWRWDDSILCISALTVSLDGWHQLICVNRILRK
jgi:hypothetical protein